MIWRIHKSTLGDWNHGQTSTFAKCYYTGAATCWEIRNDGAFNEEGVCAVKRKIDAELMVDFFNESGWDGKVGDPMGIFLNHCREYGDYETIDKIKEV